MNGYVWFFLLAAVIGTTLYVYIPSWIQQWREASAALDLLIRDALTPGDFERWEKE